MPLALHAGRLHNSVPVKLSWAIEVLASTVMPVLIEQARACFHAVGDAFQ